MTLRWRFTFLGAFIIPLLLIGAFALCGHPIITPRLALIILSHKHDDGEGLYAVACLTNCSDTAVLCPFTDAPPVPMCSLLAETSQGWTNVQLKSQGIQSYRTTLRGHTGIGLILPLPAGTLRWKCTLSYARLKPHQLLTAHLWSSRWGTRVVSLFMKHPVNTTLDLRFQSVVFEVSPGH